MLHGSVRLLRVVVVGPTSEVIVGVGIDNQVAKKSIWMWPGPYSMIRKVRVFVGTRLL